MTLFHGHHGLKARRRLYSDKEAGSIKGITEWRDITVPLLTLFSGLSLNFKISFQIWIWQVSAQPGNDWQIIRALGQILKEKMGSYISKVPMAGHLRSERLINKTTTHTGNMLGPRFEQGHTVAKYSSPKPVV